MPPSRRSFVAGLAALATGGSGCASIVQNPLSDDETPGGETTAETTTCDAVPKRTGTAVETETVTIVNATTAQRQVHLVVTRTRRDGTQDRDTRRLSATAPDCGQVTLFDREITVGPDAERTVEDVIPIYDRLTEYRVFATVAAGGEGGLAFGAAGPYDYGYLNVEITRDGAVEFSLAVP